LETEKFKLKDIGWGLIVPILVGLLVIFFPAVLRPTFDAWFPAATSPYAFLTVIFTHGFAQIIVFAIPVLLGLIWNKWAGGSAGFLTGTLYYLAYAGYFSVGITADFGAPYYPGGLYRDPSFIGNYIVGGMLVGYITGSLNNGSFNFKRMIGSGLTAALVVGVMQFLFNISISFAPTMSRSVLGFAETILPMLIVGIVVPIVSKVMTWYGMYPQRHQ
jgi:hypothetical protein